MLAKLKLSAQSDFDPGVETDEQLWSLIKKLVQKITKNHDQKSFISVSNIFQARVRTFFNLGETLHEMHICLDGLKFSALPDDIVAV